MELNKGKLVIIGEEDKHELGKCFRDYLLELDNDAEVKILHIESFLSAIFKNINRQLYWFVIDNVKVGFAFLLTQKRWPLTNKPYGRIAEFYVFRGYRRKGIGKFFAEKLISLLNDMGCVEIDLEVLHSNSKGLSFWKNIGFDFKKYIMNYKK